MASSMASSSSHKLLVVGGNGYLGSAICKAGVARGWDVTSISSSGKPWRTPAGHSRKWTESVKWKAADAFEPESYRELVAGSSAVVHTLGILIEDEEYKKHVRSGNLMGLVSSLLGQGEGNPLMRGLNVDGKGKQPMTYERMNRDSGEFKSRVMGGTLSAYPFLCPPANSSCRAQHHAPNKVASTSTICLHLGRRHLPTVHPCSIRLHEAGS